MATVGACLAVGSAGWTNPADQLDDDPAGTRATSLQTSSRDHMLANPGCLPRTSSYERDRLCCSARSTSTKTRIDFAYDGEGHRTSITETPPTGLPVVTTFRYQGDAIVAEYRGGTLHREYTVDAGGTISKITVLSPLGASTYLVTWNGHGDALALYRIETSGALTLANSYTYSTWGLPTTATHNGIADLGFRFLYVGAADVQWDGTYGLPLLYMHARHYSPSLGRFLQPDPSRQDAQLFVYAGNGPVSRVDPSGEIAWFALLVPIAMAVVRSVAVRALPAVVRAFSTAVASEKAIQRGLQHVNDRHGWPAVVEFTKNLGRLGQLFPNTSKFWPMSNAGWERILRGAETGRVISATWQWHWWPPHYTWQVVVRQTFSTNIGYDARSNVITRTVYYFIENGSIVSFRPGS